MLNKESRVGGRGPVSPGRMPISEPPRSPLNADSQPPTPVLLTPGPQSLAPMALRSRRLLGLLSRLLLGAGIVLFVVLVYRLGPATVWDNLRLIGAGFILVLAQEGVSYLFNTAGWRCAFPPGRPPVRFRQLLAARLAGEAINN